MYVTQQPHLTVFSPPPGYPDDCPHHNVRVSALSPSLGISQLDGDVHSLASLGLSPATTSSYNSGVNCYLTFSHSCNPSSFPLTELTLCRFVAFLVHEGLFYSSIRLYLCALRHRQLLDGGNNPALHSLHRLHYVIRVCHRSLPLAA